MRPPAQGEPTSDGLVYRYDAVRTPDGLDGVEGAFSLCPFWLVETLARARRLDEARLLFERMLGYANHPGLYSEEVDPRCEEPRNFSQAFTPLALINAAFNLDRAFNR